MNFDVVNVPGRPSGPLAASDACPFCPGNEDQTRPALWVDGAPWSIRVFENWFPIAVPPRGAHWVIVECPRHDDAFERFSAQRIGAVLRVYRERERAACAVPGVAYVLLYKNAGFEAGASQPHSHAQCLALDFVPGPVNDALGRRLARTHCAECNVRGDAERRGTLVVKDGAFTAWVPPRARFPFEISVVPLRHASRLADATDEELDALAVLLTDLFARMRAAGAPGAYNMTFFSAPPGCAGAAKVHWELSLIPRGSNRLAALEVGIGLYINTHDPQFDASALRDALA